MNFSERGTIPSCSSLGRIKNCGGSWALSKGVPDEVSKDAEKGTDVHDALKAIILGKLLNPQTETELLAWKLWGHMQKAAFELFGEAELIWESEKRLWMNNDNLEPILSGQFDAVCYPAGDESHAIAIFDAKTGWQAGDVPMAVANPQMLGLADLVYDHYGREVYGAIVREWACDRLEPIGDGSTKELAEAVHGGEYDVWHKAGLRTGEWCQFCPAKGNCPAYRDAFQMVVRTPNDGDLDSFNLQLEMIESPILVRILRASPMAEKVIEAAKKEAHRRREAGEELPGVFWEKGNKKREISDPTKFGMKMLAEGIDLGAFQKTDMPIGPAYKAWLKKKEKKDNKTSKDEFNRTFADCISTSENAPSLTFES